MVLPIVTNGQSTEELIDDAWVYCDTFDNFKRDEIIELVKSWKTPMICVVSFEDGKFHLSGKFKDQMEVGSWKIEKADNKTFLLITKDSGHVDKFEIISVDDKILKLKRII